MSTRTIPKQRSRRSGSGSPSGGGSGATSWSTSSATAATGHNEGDEASFTQPLMAERIANHPSVRALYAQRLAEAGEVPAEEAERLAKETQEQMRAAHDELKTELTRAQPSSGESTPISAEALGRNERPGRAAARAPRRARQRPGRLHRQSEAREDARTASRSARPRRHRLGPGGVARVREPARRGHPDPPDRTGHRAGHVLAPAPRPARRAHRRSARADQAPRGRVGLDRGVQLAALGIRGPRLRVRLLGDRARGARALGSAVRRFHQRRADHRRPVPGLRPREVATDVAADPASPSRLRGQRPRALERPARALPPAGRAGEHPRRQRDHGRAVLPSPPPAGARPEREAADRHDPEGAAPPQGGDRPRWTTSPTDASSRCSTTRRWRIARR